MTMTTTAVVDRAQNGVVNEHDDAVDPAAKPTRRRFSNDFKDRIVDEYDGADGSEARGALLRREGIYSSHISEWRNQRARRNQPAATSKDRRRRTAEQAELDQLRKKTAKLESESPWFHRRLSTLVMKERDEHFEEEHEPAVLA